MGHCRQERFRSISFNSLRKSDACILVFDLTVKSSFEKVTEWLKKIRDTMPKIPIALFGNKLIFQIGKSLKKK